VPPDTLAERNARIDDAALCVLGRDVGDGSGLVNEENLPA
jgi:hypothetical protein